MLIQKPKSNIPTVRIKLQQFAGSEYKKSTNACLTVYHATVPEVMALIQQAIARKGKNGAK